MKKACVLLLLLGAQPAFAQAPIAKPSTGLTDIAKAIDNFRLIYDMLAEKVDKLDLKHPGDPPKLESLSLASTHTLPAIEVEGSRTDTIAGVEVPYRRIN